MSGSEPIARSRLKGDSYYGLFLKFDLVDSEDVMVLRQNLFQVVRELLEVFRIEVRDMGEKIDFFEEVFAELVRGLRRR